ncbi:MAG: B12-binding domain-containing radical SAM protein [Candidatus Margulisbacteria bacterium]|nr:B12-binding domain-containing radical SAM protein [Candidatus Margulisiibacteriota bacterium]MBU1021513.1 B12-binding domain-containing radical SAM protein [Candidatus Margulisiibacteriota bacterium]MBU1728598.1 B12-binding domain-containing radical SAM protein [Candidatus Margulisiibacteriota bacterium]MBU1955823.1 B12-binding domain-containing radical SAM protein [Candidatus Margulisiibacteriota bacterium]
MKILLINPPIREWSKPNVFPLGLGYLASILLQEKHEVEILDINAYRWDKNEVENVISKANFDMVGIGGIVTTYKYVKWLVPVIKKYHPDKKIMIGGSVGSSIPQIMLEKNPVDIVCIGEGEETIKELVEAVGNKRDLSQVRGIWFKDDSGKIIKTEKRPPLKNLDVNPFPAWDLFPMDIYLKNPVGAPNRNKWVDGSVDENVPLSMNLYATRGCPYKCIYCYHDFMGHGYRNRSAENVVKEIETLYNKYGVSYFHFIDDEFVMKKDFVYKFCALLKELMQELNQKITWGCAGRVNLMTEDLIRTMVDAGCISLCYGIESGSQRMLDLIKKSVTVEQAKNAIRLTQKYLEWADCSFMIGYPGETKETIQETIEFCKEADLTPEVIFFITPYPGTELYDLALQQGKIKDEEEYVLGLGEQGEKIRVNFTDFTDEELFAIQSQMVKELKAWNTIKHTAG